MTYYSVFDIYFKICYNHIVGPHFGGLDLFGACRPFREDVRSMVRETYTREPFPGEGGRAEDYFGRNLVLWLVVMIAATVVSIALLLVLVFLVRGWLALAFIAMILWVGGIAVWLWCGLFRFAARTHN